MKRANLLEILGVCTKEDVHTNLFKYCIENSQQFREAFFSSVLEWPSATPMASIDTRMSLPEIGLPDMVVAGGDMTHRRVGIIELKLHAEEGKDQTNHYASPECLRRILFGLEIESCTNPDFVFLTLYPDQQPENEKFRSASLRQLLGALQKRPVLDDTIAAQLLQDWAECLDDFYSSGTLNDDDVLVDKLASGTALDSGYLSFAEFFRSIRPHGLEASGTWRSSPQGRPYFGVKYQKASWHPNVLPSTNWARFDPSRHFDIHIECQFHRLAGRLEVLVHYETGPYKPQIKNVLSARKFNAHMERRKEFKASLSELLHGKFVVASDRSINQIARLDVSLTKSTVRDSRRRFSRLLSKTAKAIDQALLSLS